MVDNHGDELDGMIDAALSGYSEPAPPVAGLEQRVVQRIRRLEAGRRRSRRLLVGLALAAALLFAAVLLRTRPGSATAIEVARIQSPPAAAIGPVAAEDAPPAPKLKSGVPVRRVAHRLTLPKQPQFPAPQPLTGEERALLAFVQRFPAEAQTVFAGIQNRNSEIDVQPIQIPPLLSDGTQ